MLAIARSTAVENSSSSVAALGVEKDSPPERRGTEHVAGLWRRRPACATQLGFRLIEARFEDEVVGAGQTIDAANGVCRRAHRTHGRDGERPE